MPLRRHLPDQLPELTALLEVQSLPVTVPERLVRAAIRAGVISVLAARHGAREALGQKAVNQYLSQAAIGALRLREFGEILNAMRDRKIDVVPLKGMAYGLMFHSGGPVRSMADIDLLVRSQDYKRAGDVMKALGYREEFHDPLATNPGHHERQFVKEGRLVEIHRYFLRGHRITVNYGALWNRVIPIESDGIRCMRLSPEDTLLYHCFHMGMHEFSMGGLMSVWELRRLILEDHPDIRACADRAAEWSTRRITWCALQLLDSCFAIRKNDTPYTIHDMSPPPFFRLVLDKLIVTPSLSLLLSPGPLPRHIQLLRKAILMDSVTRGAHYLLWYLKSQAVSLL